MSGSLAGKTGPPGPGFVGAFCAAAAVQKEASTAMVRSFIVNTSKIYVQEELFNKIFQYWKLMISSK